MIFTCDALDDQTLRQFVRQVVDEAGNQGVEADAMNHAGLSRSVAMQLTGHKTEAVYRRYAITSEADLREGVDRLNGATWTRRMDNAADSAKQSA